MLRIWKEAQGSERSFWQKPLAYAGNEVERTLRAKEKNKSEAWCFGFERRRKEVNAVFGKSLWLMPETKLSGLCAQKKKQIRSLVLRI